MRDKMTLSAGRERRARHEPYQRIDVIERRHPTDANQQRVASYRDEIDWAIGPGPWPVWCYDLILALRRPADVACPTCGDKGTIKGYMREDGRNGVQPRTDVFDRPCPNLGYHHAETGGCAPIPVAAPLPTDASEEVFNVERGRCVPDVRPRRPRGGAEGGEVTNTPRDCIHGSLARSCPLCELQADLKASEARVKELEAELARRDEAADVSVRDIMADLLESRAEIAALRALPSVDDGAQYGPGAPPLRPGENRIVRRLMQTLKLEPCRDHSCVQGGSPVKGMGTNGGCRCANNVESAVFDLMRAHPDKRKR
jgi:hypothetical protein